MLTETGHCGQISWTQVCVTLSRVPLLKCVDHLAGILPQADSAHYHQWAQHFMYVHRPALLQDQGWGLGFLLILFLRVREQPGLRRPSV